MSCDHEYEQIGKVLADTSTTTFYRCTKCKQKTEHRKRWHGDDWRPASERAYENGYDPDDYKTASPDDYKTASPDDGDDAA